MDCIIQKVKEKLPSLSDTVIQQLSAALEEHGVECWSDIAALKEHHLVPPLKTVQCIKLLAAVVNDQGM
jgi:hypothetical protein